MGVDLLDRSPRAAGRAAVSPPAAQVSHELLAAGRRALRVRDVRTGFSGSGLPAARSGRAGVPTDSPLLFGFHSGLRGNQAGEHSIAIRDGPLAGGTTMHVSRIVLDLEGWHALDEHHRAALMFSPATSPAEADRATGDAPSHAEQLPSLAARRGAVGHSRCCYATAT